MMKRWDETLLKEVEEAKEAEENEKTSGTGSRFPGFSMPGAPQNDKRHSIATAKAYTARVVAAEKEAAIVIHKWLPGTRIPSSIGQIDAIENYDSVEFGNNWLISQIPQKSGLTNRSDTRE